MTTSSKTFPNQDDIRNIEGFIQTLNITTSDDNPSYTPRTFSDQFLIVNDGSSTSAFIYDTKNTAWNYINLTTI